MPAKKKSWCEKLADDKGLPKVETIMGKMSKRFGTGTVVIPAPLEVDVTMKTIRRGRLTTIAPIREALAARHAAAIACPMTKGVFAWIAAHAAGRKRITPYGHTLKAGGVEGLKQRPAAEEHAVVQKGKRFVVDDYERVMATPDVC